MAAAREALLPLEDVMEALEGIAETLEDVVEVLDDETEVLAAEAMGDVEEAATGAWMSEVIAEVALTSPDSAVSVEDGSETL